MNPRDQEQFEREWETVLSLNRHFLAPQFIDLNKSCMPDYMNENLFSKDSSLEATIL